MFSPLRAWLRGALLFVTGGAAGDDPRQAGAPADPAEAAQLEDFRQLTFGQPGGQLAKWQQPLRIALVEPPGAEAREIARRHFADLAALSGLTVEESGPRDANLLVFFADDPVESARRHRGLYIHRVPANPPFETMRGERTDRTCFALKPD